MSELSRRDLLAILAAGTGVCELARGTNHGALPMSAAGAPRIRAIVAGVELSSPMDGVPLWLFPVPGRKSGDLARFDDERLVACRIFDV